MSYKITEYTKQIAKENGYVIKPSTNKRKKIDVYRDGMKIASLGALGMSDYPTYIKSHGIQYARERRRLYYIRHPNHTQNENLTKLLLW
jgi:hypothetical protein